MTIRILCYNIHGGYDMGGVRDLSRVHALMEEMKIDIGVFQEVETRPSRGGTADDITSLSGVERPHHLAGLAMQEEGGWYGNLIVSRYPIIRGMAHGLDTLAGLEPRNAIDALIQTPRGPLRIVGTHLSLLAAVRWQEVQKLLQLIGDAEAFETNPMLVMGDINEWRGGARLLQHLNDSFIALPAARTFPSCFPLFHLDRVWAHNVPQVDVQRLKTGRLRRLSDHLPLLINVHDIR